MNLTALAPKWYVLHDGGPKSGLTFQCPHCLTQRLAVAFHPHGEQMMLEHEPEAHHLGPEWTLTGDDDFHSFEHVTLTPSVDASKFGHWHGWITNGEIT